MKRLFQLLLAFAMLLAPLTMVGGGAAMAMPHGPTPEMAMDHCAGMDAPSKDQPTADIDCMMTCAAVPPLVPRLEAQLIAPATLPHFAPAAAPRGLDPEAETPPPRFS
jgi:hypothetical protein